MAEAVALNPGFLTKYEETTDNIYEKLKSRTDKVILDSMLKYLEGKKIGIDGKIRTLDEFKSKIFDTLDKQTQLELAKIEATMQVELSSLIKNLKDGSQSALSKFVENIAMPIGETIVKSAAIKTAFDINPAAGAIALGGISFVPTIAKGIKSIKDKNEEVKNTALDIALMKLAVEKKGDDATYSISNEEKEKIAEVLKRRNVSIKEDVDIVNFIQGLTELDIDSKKAVVDVLNELRGKPYDIDAIVKQTKASLGEINKIIGKEMVQPLSLTALYGLTLANAASSISSDEMGSIVSALVVGGATGNTIAGVGTGGLSYVLAKAGDVLPKSASYIKGAFDKLNEKMAESAGNGSALGIAMAARIIPALVIGGGKAIADKIKGSGEGEKDNLKTKLDTAIVDVDNEILKRPREGVLFDIFKDLCTEEGITIPKEIRSLAEIKEYIKNMSSDDKKEVYKIASALEKVRDSHEDSFVKTAKTIGKAAYWGGIIALAGLGAYNAWINPGFIDREKEKLAKGKDNKGETQTNQSQKIDVSNQISTNSVNSEDKMIKEIMEGTSTSKSGKVIGIDVSENMPADQLKELLQSKDGIPSNLYDVDGNLYNASNYSGKVNYVMIKIGARGYGDEGNLIDNGIRYAEQAAVCEELGVPYGFYYYSTALTKEEAAEEIAEVAKNLGKLESTKYNVLPFALDIEQCDGSRLCGKDVTDIAAYWANEAEATTGKVMLYSGGRDVSRTSSERIINLTEFNKQLNSGPARIWTPGPRNMSGDSVYDANQAYINSIAEEGGDISVIQAYLDQSNHSEGLTNRIDIDIVDKDVLEKMIREKTGILEKTADSVSTTLIEPDFQEIDNSFEGVPNLEQEIVAKKNLPSRLFEGFKNIISKPFKSFFNKKSKALPAPKNNKMVDSTEESETDAEKFARSLIDNGKKQEKNNLQNGDKKTSRNIDSILTIEGDEEEKA